MYVHPTGTLRNAALGTTVTEPGRIIELVREG